MRKTATLACRIVRPSRCAIALIAGTILSIFGISAALAGAATGAATNFNGHGPEYRRRATAAGCVEILHHAINLDDEIVALSAQRPTASVVAQRHQKVSERTTLLNQFWNCANGANRNLTDIIATNGAVETTQPGTTSPSAAPPVAAPPVADPPTVKPTLPPFKIGDTQSRIDTGASATDDPARIYKPTLSPLAGSFDYGGQRIDVSLVKGHSIGDEINGSIKKRSRRPCFYNHIWGVVVSPIEFRVTKLRTVQGREISLSRKVTLRAVQPGEAARQPDC